MLTRGHGKKAITFTFSDRGQWANDQPKWDTYTFMEPSRGQRTITAQVSPSFNTVKPKASGNLAATLGRKSGKVKTLVLTIFISKRLKNKTYWVYLETERLFSAFKLKKKKRYEIETKFHFCTSESVACEIYTHYIVFSQVPRAFHCCFPPDGIKSRKV